MNIENLKAFNHDVIPVYITSDGKKITIGRELHEGLKIETDYPKWFDRMAEYGFAEGTDYTAFWESGSESIFDFAHFKSPQQAAALGYAKNHVLTLTMAKHICMIQRTPEGKRIRDKLIELDDNVEDFIQHRLEEERKRVYPVKASSLGEAVNWAKLQNNVQKDQGSAAWKRAAAFEKTARQFGIDIIPGFVEPPQWESQQMALEAAPTVLIGHVDSMSIGAPSYKTKEDV